MNVLELIKQGSKKLASKNILSHKDVIEVASQSKIKLMRLLSGVIKGVKE